MKWPWVPRRWYDDMKRAADQANADKTGLVARIVELHEQMRVLEAEALER